MYKVLGGSKKICNNRDIIVVTVKGSMPNGSIKKEISQSVIVRVTVNSEDQMVLI